MSFSIADLPVTDDLNVPVSAEEYVDQANPAPAKPGNYRLVVTKHAVRTTKDGQLFLADGKFPTIVLEQAKIVEPVDAERGIGLFTDVRTKPFERKGAGGVAIVASDLYDLLRAYDDTQNIDGFDHAKSLLQTALDGNQPFYAQIGWTGYDKAFVDAEFAALESAGTAKADVSKDVSNAIYAKARKNTKDFVQNGILSPTVVGPSGALIEAKLKLTRYFPSSTEVGKGKDAKGRSRIELGPFKAGQTK